MNANKNLLSEKLSNLLAALRNSQPQQSNRFQANYDTQQTTVREKESGVVIETVPELLDFLKWSTNPKVLRDVVARFLSNPSLSESERGLIRTKVLEKIEEEKGKKRASKLLVTNTNTCGSSGSSSQQLVDNSCNFTAQACQQTVQNESQSYDVSAFNASPAFADGIAQSPLYAQQYYLPHNSAMIGNLPPNHGYAGFQTETTPVYDNQTISCRAFPISMVPQTPPPSPTPPTLGVDSCIRPGELVAVMSATGRLIMPGARIIPRSYKEKCDFEDVKNDTAVNQSFNGKSCDLEHLKNETPVNQGIDDKMLENNNSIAGDEKTAKKINRQFSSKNISGLFGSPEDESLGKACYIQQYALRHNLSFKEAEEKVEANGIFGKHVARRRLRKKCKSRVYTKGCEPFPNQKYAKNYEGTEEVFAHLECDESRKRFNMSSPRYPTGREEVVHEADYEGWSHSSSSYDATDSNAQSQLEDSREYWPPAYPDQWTLTVGKKRNLN